MSQEAKITRRDLMMRGVAIGAGLMVLGPVLGGCQAQKEKDSLVITGVVNVGPASDYPAGTASTKFLAKYGIVLTNESGTVLAVQPKCTYDGTTTEWDAEHVEFVCPSCKSKFNILGQVTKVNKGPARKSLAGVSATTNPDGTLSVDLDKLYKISAEVTPGKDAKPPGSMW